jgi:peptide/nickel transport system ATP-binding protein
MTKVIADGSRLLQIDNLAVEYHTDYGVTKAVNGIDLSIDKGEAMGLVGESGSGKTTTALSILRLLPKPAAIRTSGSIIFDDESLDAKSERQMQELRGNRISMIFQNPLTSLNPVFTIGEQIAMVFQRHYKLSGKKAMAKAAEMLEIVDIPSRRLTDYPHQFSGGMRQRVGIAAGLACNPQLLIADEPTTALDVTIQLQIIELLKQLQHEYDTSLMMITHNLGIISELCTNVSVMYAGVIVEKGPVDKVFKEPLHPYTAGLLGSLPKLTGPRERLVSIEGSAAGAGNITQGCKFYPRCEMCSRQCREVLPKFVDLGGGHRVLCHKYLKGSDEHE